LSVFVLSLFFFLSLGDLSGLPPFFDLAVVIPLEVVFLLSLQ